MSAVDWLLAGDPAIRWQTMRDLTGATSGDIAAERARVAGEGWGARLLALQRDDGSWAGGAWFPAIRPDREAGQPWTSTAHVLMLLTLLGVDPDSPRVRDAVESAFAHVRWEEAGQRFLDGESEACVNGHVVAIGSYFGHDMTPLVERLLSDRRADGGWNCEPPERSQRSSFHSTICALEGLAAFRRAHGDLPGASEAVEEAHELLLQRRLMIRLSTGEVIDPAFQLFSFPTYWHYDVLRALDYLRDVDAPRDARIADAIALVRSKMAPAGRWCLENTHRGAVPLVMEDGDGSPSRWNTLRAQRVLRWWEGG